MKKNKTFIALVALALGLLFSFPMLFYWLASEDFYGRKVDTAAYNFLLQDVEGKPHALSEHLGRYVYLYFGYLNCNDVCHNQVGVMFNLHHQSHAEDLDFIFITMDPKRDSPAFLKEYFNQFGTNFVSLTAESMPAVQRVAAEYNAYFFTDGETKSGKDYEITHPGTIYLIDPVGRIQLMYQGQYLRYDKMLEDLAKLKTIQLKP